MLSFLQNAQKRTEIVFNLPGKLFLSTGYAQEPYRERFTCMHFTKTSRKPSWPTQTMSMHVANTAPLSQTEQAAQLARCRLYKTQ